MLYSYMLWLTPVWSLFPELGALGIILRLIAKYCLAGFIPFSMLLSHTGVPTLAAIAAWRYSAVYSRLFLIFLPILSVAAFLARVGLTPNACFSLYWLLLPALFFTSSAVRTHVITRSIIASLTAHMLGALIVAFFGAPVAWFKLVPLVPFERFVAATGMLVTCTAIALFKRVTTQFLAHKNSSI